MVTTDLPLRQFPWQQTVRSKDFVGANAGLCVPRQKAVRELDFFDVNPRVCSQNSAGELDSENITACNQVENAPVLHVFDPAVHAALAPMVEYDGAATMAYRVHMTPAPAVEYDAPASTLEYQAHAVPAPVDEYDAPAARAAPSPLVDVPIVQVVQVPQVQVVKKTIEIPQLQTIEKIVDTPEIQTVQSTQSSESLETAPVLEMAPAEIVEGVEFWPPLPAESAPPLFAAAPTVGPPPVVVEYIQPSVVEYVAPAPAVTCAALAPVVEYVRQAENSDIETK